ncbi:MAG: hypothetical protein AAFS10_15400 [Myxococcota bacterium]
MLIQRAIQNRVRPGPHRNRWPAHPNNTHATAYAMSEFGRLRELVHAPPSHAAWHALCDHLQTWPEPELRELVLDYVAEHTQHWPDRLMIPPASWLHAASEGRAVPQLLAARTLTRPPTSREPMGWGTRLIHLERKADVWSWDNWVLLRLPRLLTTPWLQNITTIRLHALGLRQTAALAEALQHAKLPHLTTLELSYGTFTCDSLTDLLNAPPLRNLRTLILEHVHARSVRSNSLDAPLRHFAQTLPLPHLEHLSLSGTPLPKGFHTTLLTHPAAAKLRHLSLSSPRRGDPIELDLESTTLRSLDTLTLTWASLTAAQIAQLKSHPALNTLHELNLIQVRADALEELFHNPNFASHLQRLHIQPVDSNADLSARIATRSTLTSLHALDIKARGAPHAAVRLATTNPLLTQINLAGSNATSHHVVQLVEHLTPQQLWLDGCHRLDTTAIEALATCTQLNTLTLSVASNIAGPLGPEAAERLAHLSPLRVLSLSGQPIGDRGVCTLVQSPHLLNLESLDLSHTGASSRAYRTLASRCALPALRHLYLRGTTPNLEALSALTQAPRMRQLEFVYLPPQLTTAKPGSEADAQLRAYRATIATAPLPERFKVASRCHNDTLDDFWTLNDFRFSAPHPNITDAIEELLRHMHPDERRTTNQRLITGFPSRAR